MDLYYGSTLVTVAFLAENKVRGNRISREGEAQGRACLVTMALDGWMDEEKRVGHWESEALGPAGFSGSLRVPVRVPEALLALVLSCLVEWLAVAQSSQQWRSTRPQLSEQPQTRPSLGLLVPGRKSTISGVDPFRVSGTQQWGGLWPRGGVL